MELIPPVVSIINPPPPRFSHTQRHDRETRHRECHFSTGQKDSSEFNSSLVRFWKVSSIRVTFSRGTASGVALRLKNAGVCVKSY